MANKAPLEYYEAKCDWVKSPSRADSLTHAMNALAYISGIKMEDLYTVQLDFNNWEVYTNAPHDYKVGTIVCKAIDSD